MSCLFAGGAFAACGSDPVSKPEGAALSALPKGPRLRIVSPTSGSVLSGDASVELDAFTLDDHTELLFGVEGSKLLPLRGPVRTLQLATRNVEDGDHALLARMTTADGQVLEDRVEVKIDNPDQRLVSLLPSAPEYERGSEVVLDVVYSTAALQVSADFSELDSGYQPAAVRVEDLGAGHFRLRYSISMGNSKADGLHRVIVRAANSVGEAIEDSTRVRFRAAPEVPLVVSGASYLDAPAPALSAAEGPAPVIQSMSLSGSTLLRGGTLDLDVTWTLTPSEPVAQLELSVQGFSGYFVVPVAASAAAQGQVHLGLSLPSNAPGFVDASILRVRPVLIGPRSRPLDWAFVDLPTRSVSSDGVQVGVSWDNGADVDLSIIDPLGNLLDFESPMVDGGKLDLDSNALCEGNGTNAESISWKVGGELQGTYQVRINLFDTCSQDTVRWRITAQFCGQSQVFNGTLSAADVDTMGNGQLVTQFEVACNQVVRGAVVREKVTDVTHPEAFALATVPYAPIRAVSADGATTFAESVTDKGGRFDLRWQDLALSDFVIEVDSTYIHPLSNRVIATVVPLAGGDTYKFRSSPVLGMTSEVRKVIEQISIADNAGAFNVLDALRRGFDWVLVNVRPTLGNRLPPLIQADWTDGADTDITNSYYSAKMNQVLINGSVDVPHQWSDSLLLHEFSHLVMHNLSYDTSPGGAHQLDSYSNPALAWSEGAATALGQTVLGSSISVTMLPVFSFGYDTETLNAVVLGTSDGTTTGKVSEQLVATVLWDLFDGKNEPHDAIEDPETTLTSMFERMPADGNGNTADLADFLDQFREDSSGAEDAPLDCVTTAVAYPYTYPDGVICAR